MATGPLSTSPLCAWTSFSIKREEEMVFLGVHSCGSIQSSLQEWRKSGHRGSVAQSQSAATSVPGFSAASEWAQSSGHAIKKGGACSGSENGPRQEWLGRGGHTSCYKTDPPPSTLRLRPRVYCQLLKGQQLSAFVRCCRCAGTETVSNTQAPCHSYTYTQLHTTNVATCTAYTITAKQASNYGHNCI